jgi:hypothetical protein
MIWTMLGMLSFLSMYDRLVSIWSALPATPALWQFDQNNWTLLLFTSAYVVSMPYRYAEVQQGLNNGQLGTVHEVLILSHINQVLNV